MPKANETLLEIDLNALDHNYRYITSKIKPGTKVLAVVKAFGYGSDSVVIAKELADLGADYFAVAYANEGETLRNASIETPILVLHTLPINFEVILNRCLNEHLFAENAGGIHRFCGRKKSEKLSDSFKIQYRFKPFGFC